MPIKINGATSGSTTITAPATGGDESIELSTALAAKLDSSSYTEPGLVLISPSSIANSGGSASSTDGTTTVTGVSTVSLNGVFSVGYENYLVKWRGLASAGGTLFMRLRTSGTDATGSDYARQTLEAAGGTVLGSAATTTYMYVTWLATNLSIMNLDLFGPFSSGLTGFSSIGGKPSNSMQLMGHHNVASSYDGMTLYPSSGSITGTIRVYGYKGA